MKLRTWCRGSNTDVGTIIVNVSGDEFRSIPLGEIAGSVGSDLGICFGVGRKLRIPGGNLKIGDETIIGIKGDLGRSDSGEDADVRVRNGAIINLRGGDGGFCGEGSESNAIEEDGRSIERTTDIEGIARRSIVNSYAGTIVEEEGISELASVPLGEGVIRETGSKIRETGFGFGGDGGNSIVGSTDPVRTGPFDGLSGGTA